MSSLRSITSQLIDVLREVEENDGELTPELEKVLGDIELASRNKVDAYYYRIKTYEELIPIVDEKLKEYQSAKKRLKSTIDWLKDNLKSRMKSTQSNVAEGNEVRYSLSESTKPFVFDENKLPSEYKIVTTTYKPDLIKIRNALKAGVEIPGVSLEPVYTLRSKVKVKEISE